MAGRKMNAKGRNKFGSFVLLTRFMVGHASWLDLDPKARCIYIELRRLYCGTNNGELWLSCRDAAKVAKCGKSTASIMFKQLEAHGYIKPSGKGHFGNKHASRWILTNELYDGIKTDEWVHWSKKKNNSPSDRTDSPAERTEMILLEQDDIESVRR